MSPNVLLEIAELQDKTVSQLVQRYGQVFEEECRSRNKQYLIRLIAWRLQPVIAIFDWLRIPF